MQAPHQRLSLCEDWTDQGMVKSASGADRGMPILDRYDCPPRQNEYRRACQGGSYGPQGASGCPHATSSAVHCRQNTEVQHKERKGIRLGQVSYPGH